MIAHLSAGDGYCRLHRPHADIVPSETPPSAAEQLLGRRILTQPPDLNNWIKRCGGYANITAEGWAEYDAAMKAWLDRR